MEYTHKSSVIVFCAIVVMFGAYLAGPFGAIASGLLAVIIVPKVCEKIKGL